jgi:hypothetical protein
MALHVALLAAAALAPAEVDLAELQKIAPNLAAMVSRAALEPDALAEELRASPIAQIAPTLSARTPRSVLTRLNHGPPVGSEAHCALGLIRRMLTS